MKKNEPEADANGKGRETETGKAPKKNFFCFGFALESVFGDDFFVSQEMIFIVKLSTHTSTLCSRTRGIDVRK